MKNWSLIFSTGLAMFSMFFGSGNLVFPLVVGQMSEGHFTWAALGLLLTGVLIPFLGILAILLFQGSSRDFFGRLGKPATFWIPLIALSLMGPFGVLPRCITVAHGAFKLLLPGTELWVFSLVACALIFFLTIRKHRIVSVLGAVLTPILLLSLAAIAFFGFKTATFPQTTLTSVWGSFKLGVFQGYQTMDLLAAFFFSTFVLQHLQTKRMEPSRLLPVFFKSALVGAGLLALIYVALVFLGAGFASELTSMPPEEMLGYVAQASLGPWAAPIVCCAVILACLTTAIVLAALFADFFKKEIAKDKAPTSVALILTLAIAFCVSTLHFSGIARFLGPILEITYPALIVLTFVNIFHKLWGWRMIRIPTCIAVVAKLLSAI